MKWKKKNKNQGDRCANDQSTKGQERPKESVWNFGRCSGGQGADQISLDEYMDFMSLFLNRLYPMPGYRVTAMTYMRDAIYMKITKESHTATEVADVVG